MIPTPEALTPKFPAEPARPISRTGLCSAMVSVARANGLPAPFFANLIWQESGFDPRVVSRAGRAGHCPVHAGDGKGVWSRSIRSIRSMRSMRPENS